MTADLAAIRARLAAATPGPWHAWDRGIGYEVHRGPESDCRSEYGTGVNCCTELNDGFRETFRKADADLIAHAPADLAALCAEVESLRLQVGRAAEQYGYAVHELDLAASAVERVRARAASWSEMFRHSLTPEGQTLRDAGHSILEALDGTP